LVGAMSHRIGHTPTTEGGALLCTNLGGTTGQSSFYMYKRLLGRISQNLRWTGRTLIKGTRPITCDSSPEASTWRTGVASPRSKRKLQTYDLAYAGPRNRFTIGTDSGPVIAHNCGYGMGHIKFRAQLKNFGVDLPEDECERIIRVYRETYPAIPALWREANKALKTMMQDKVDGLGREGILSVEGTRGIRLPNGLYIKYPNLRVQEPEEEGGYDETVYDTRKGRAILPNRIYGGKVIENVCQALARNVIGEQLLNVAKKYKVVMTVHDAIGCIVREAQVEGAMQQVEEIMKVRPVWAPDLPLDCEGGYGNSYGEC